ncbi:hypothetical protein R5H30_05115 [Sulfitobacter sp. D35]|uniref:hypothetical protein n=1 Tax=Sulfitobacter sp. D35 TaxID=3083252 RepID=UPI00296F5159|nr:hypothetical protein [Sulfitobacter sp. D35]MDW4497353.1 hypothetical protein [Sulfitobacter sp. D35]
MALIEKLRTAAHKRAVYNRTVRELSTMPLDTALDLGLYREDARANAHRAVYGY